MWSSLSQLFGNLFQCNSHSKSDNIPVTPKKCPSSTGFHNQENEEGHYEVCQNSTDTMLVLRSLLFPSDFKYSKLTAKNIFFADLFCSHIFIVVSF